jgi:hypothetical protein
MPHWAAFTTARARLALLRMIEEVGTDAFVYSDTDSVKFERARVDYGRLKAQYIGSAYGQWKEEGIYTRFRVIAPKVYYGLMASGQVDIRAKGVPKSLLCPEFLDRAAGDEDVEVAFVQARSTRLVAKGSPMWVAASRRVTTPAKVLAWQHDVETGRFRALDWQAREEAAQAREEARREAWERAQERAFWRAEKKRLWAIIMPRGIKDSDYPFIPRGWLRKRGWGLDVWASECGYASGDELYEALQNIYFYGR